MGKNPNEFDFEDFFHLFLDSFVTNLRECLEEWLIQSMNNSSINNVASVCELTDPLPGEILKTGNLLKQGHYVTNWKKRFFSFELITNSDESIKKHYTLHYYTDETRKILKGAYIINPESILVILDHHDDKEYVLSLTANKISGEIGYICT